MTITVRDALALEVFRRAEARVLCCSEGLDRAIRWVHMGEIPDIARLLSGGELLLTGGLGVGRTAAEQRAYLDSLADVGVAALVIELAGLAFTEAPPALLSQASKRGLPVIGLRHETKFVEISAQVDTELIGARIVELEAAERIAREFRDLLLGGADHVALLDHLAVSLGRAVVLEDKTHQVRGWKPGPEGVGEATVQDWVAHARSSHSDGGRTREGTVADCAWQPITLRGETWGRVHVLLNGTPLPDSQQHAIREAAAAIAITFLGERASRATFAMRSGALLHRLLLGEIDGAGLVQHAAELGVNLRGPRLLAISVRSDGDDMRRSAEALAARRLEHLNADLGSHSVLVIRLPRGADDVTVADAIIQMGVRAGLSRVTPAAGLRTALRQSKQALDSARPGRDTSVRRFEQLGVARLLTSLQEQELADFVDDELGPLLRHDERSASKLLPTLRATLSGDGNKASAAARLHVQRRTLYYRLQRISELLEVDLSDASVRTRLDLATQALDMIRQD